LLGVALEGFGGVQDEATRAALLAGSLAVLATPSSVALAANDLCEDQDHSNIDLEIGETFKMLDPARLPGKPYSPNRPRNYAIGVLAAIVVGLALAGLIEYFDRTMRSESDVRAALNLPVLAAIPLIRVPSSHRRKRSAALRIPGAAAILTSAVAIGWRLLR